MIKKLINHSLVYAILPKLPILMGFLILPFITPFLTKVDYGIYGIVLSLVAGVTVLKTLGLEVILINSFIRHSHGRGFKIIWNEIQGFIFFWSLILGILTMFILLNILPQEATKNIWKIVLLTIFPILFYSSINIISQKYFQLNEKPIEIGVRALAIGVLSIFLNYYFIAILKIGYLGWIWSSFISESLMFLSLIYPIWIRKKLFPNFYFRRSKIKEYLKISLPLVPHTSAFFLLDFSDRLVMLRLGVSTSNIGAYDFAYKFAGYARVISESLHQASVPLLLKNFKNDKKSPYLRNIIFLQSFFEILISFLTALWLKEIFILMVNNEDLRGSYKIGVILTLSYAYKPMYTSMATVFYYYEKTKEFWKISFVAGLGNIILNLIFIPIYGYEVAVVTTFISFLYIGYAGFYVTNFEAYYNYEFYPLRWIIYTVLALIISYLAKDSNIILKVILSILFITFTVFKCRTILNKIR